MSTSNAVDPSPHIPLIYRVVNQMGFQGSDKEEAFSEGLVAITVAAQKYDPSRGVPLANWLGKNIKWSLQNWRSEQRRRSEFEAPVPISQAVIHATFENAQNGSLGASTLRHIGVLNQASVAQLDNHIALREVLEKMHEILTPLECNVILLHAIDVSGIWIAEYLGITPVAVSRTKNRAQAKLREALL